MGFFLLHKKHSLKALFALASIFVGATLFSFVSAESGAETVPPSTPTILTISAPSSSQVTLHWSASTDNVAVTGYNIYRGGAPMLLIGTTVGLDYVDTTMTPNRGWYYTVTAFDAALNESLQSAQQFINVPAIKPNPPVLAVSTGTNSATLTWIESSSGVSGFTIYKMVSGLLIEIANVEGGPTTYTVSGLPVGVYEYLVKAFIKSANGYRTYSDASNLISATIGASTTKPNAPFLSGGASADSVTLSWTESSSGVTGFKLYKIISGFWTDIGNRISPYTDSGLPAGAYSYRVQAFIQEAGGVPTYSDVSNTVVVTVGGTPGPTADITPPSTPTSLSAVARSSSQIDLTFSLVSDAVSYGIFRGGSSASVSFISTTTANSFSDTGLSPSTPYYYAVKSADAAGNVSPQSSAVWATTNASAPITDTTAPMISVIEARNIIGSGAQIFWMTDDSSDSRVYFGTAPSTGMLYSRNSNARCDSGGNVTSHCVNLADLLSGTTYYYRVASRNIDGLETISPERSFMSQLVALETATTTAPSPSAVNVSVTKGTAYCEGLSATTQVTFYSSWPSGVRFSVTKTGATAAENISSGTRLLPNGSYAWQAYANTGYSLSGVTSGNLTLDKVCTLSAVATTTSTVTPVVTPTASVALVGEAVVRVPYGGSFVDAGAKGYVNGAAVTPLRAMGDYKNSVPGTYVIRYEIVGSGGVVLASATRTVIVGDKPTTTSTTSVPPDTTTAQPAPKPPATTSTAVPVAMIPPPLAPETPAQSVTEIVSSSQYNNYCDDPVHQMECLKYATTRVVTERTATFEIPSTPGGASVLSKALSGGEQQSTPIPGGATSEAELDSVCSQTEFAPACSELLINLRLSTRADAERRLREFLAAKSEAEKVITERVGARMFRDGDEDDITDYDEINFYGTNPKEKDSNLNGVRDGDELLAGTDPSAPVFMPQSATSSTSGTSTLLSFFVNGSDATTTIGHRINFEDPKLAGDKKPDMMAVTVVKTVPSAEENGSTTKTALFLSGRSLPNSFVTLFIYSEPIVVTVKTNDVGEWTYTMDKELSDGSHEVYSAITDAGGRILAKSEPLPFTKVAAAVSLGEALLPTPAAAPGFFSGTSLYMMIAVLVVVLVGSFSLIGLMVRRRETSHAGTGAEGGNNNLFP